MPLGKVWKVESAHYNGVTMCELPKSTNYPLSNYAVFGLMSYSINGSTIHIFGGTLGAISSNFVSPFPFWLAEGKTLAVRTNMQYLIVIEFNIIQ